MIVSVDEQNICAAAKIHSAAWQESHRDFCSEEFIARHSLEAQTEYLRGEIQAGKRVYLLLDKELVGLVSVDGNLIENLYVHPQKQNLGYGSQLLEFAIEQSHGIPTLWILCNNQGAYRLYSRRGFVKTGKINQLNRQLYELELSLRRM